MPINFVGDVSLMFLIKSTITDTWTGEQKPVPIYFRRLNHGTDPTWGSYDEAMVFHSLRYAEQFAQKWIKGHYVIVRHEDEPLYG